MTKDDKTPFYYTTLSFIRDAEQRTSKMPKLTKGTLKEFYDCRILRGGKILNENLWVRDGKIIDPEKIFFEEKLQPDIRINCNNSIISPGFIDVQINGILNSFK